MVVSANRIFDGEQWLIDRALIIEAGVIKDIVPVKKVASKTSSNYSIIAPGFIDLQIYGANKKLFSVFPEVDSIKAISDYCYRSGTAKFQPTIATNSNDVMIACIDAVRAYMAEGYADCIGLHLEGPWISMEKRGAHLRKFIHDPNLQEVKKILDYGKGVITMITLAPEVCNHEIIEFIRSFGIIVSAGHSHATYDEAIDSFNNGVTAVTHLFNAMSELNHRSPGLVGAAFMHQGVVASIIPDNHHVSDVAVQIAKKAMGDRLFIITDAVTEATSGPYQHFLHGDHYKSNGTLSGSSLTMIKALKRLVYSINIPIEEAFRMLSNYPAKLMNIDNQVGRIKKGFNADLVCLSESLELIKMYKA